MRAAADLFQERGYHGTTVPAIADVAGVSAVSVQANGPKAALLLAALEMVSTGTEGFDSVLDTPVLEQILGPSASAAEMLRGTAVFAAASNARTVKLWLAMDRASDEDDAVADAYRRLVSTMRSDTRSAVGLLATRGQLRADRTHDELADLLWALVLPDLYHRLVVQAGWSATRYTQWLIEALQDQLLDGTRPDPEES